MSIIEKILGKGQQEVREFIHKTHICPKCGKGGMYNVKGTYDKNFTYSKGNYYHTECFFQKKRKW